MSEKSFASSADRRLIQKSMEIGLLEAEQEKRLALAWRDNGDQQALHALTRAYVRLAVAVASRFRNYGLPLADLIQEGVVGLMQAAQKFEPERNLRFSTYATWWIRAAIQDYVLRNWSIVRVTSAATQKSLFFNLRKLKARIAGNPAQNLTRENAVKIAAALHVSPLDVEEMNARLTAGDRSLNAAPGEGFEGEWQDILPDDRALPDELVMELRDGDRRKKWIAEALKQLTARERMIVRERQMKEHASTLEALGARLGISKERVRQIEAAALSKLKKILTDLVGSPAESGLVPG